MKIFTIDEFQKEPPKPKYPIMEISSLSLNMNKQLAVTNPILNGVQAPFSF